MQFDIVRRLREPPFGTETSERNLMASAADEIERLRAALATAGADMREKCAQAFEKRAIEIGAQECCGFGLGSPPECCGDPLFMISDRHGAAAIRAVLAKQEQPE